MTTITVKLPPNPPSKPEIADLMTDMTNQTFSRETCANRLEALLPLIKDYHRYSEEEKYQDKEFNHSLSELQQFIYNDFIIYKNPDWILLLLKYQLSPLTSQQIKENLAQQYLQAENAACLILSQRRNRLHANIFNNHPKVLKDLSFPSHLSLRIKQIILNLTARHAIINHRLYHWTSLYNLQGIIRNGHFYGNHTLVNKGLFFNKNALNYHDVMNGDGKVICLCPGMVDTDALVIKDYHDSLVCRDRLVRLTIDILQVQAKGQYNEFFKLFDFLSPAFDLRLNVNHRCHVEFSKPKQKSTLSIFIFVNDTQISKIDINKEDAIFYGNLYAINRFCLLTITKLFNKRMCDYIESLSNEEIIKFFVLIGQGMTLFAEYNFNSSLKLTPFLINEIYYAENKTLWTLHSENIDAYNDDLQLILRDQINHTRSETLYYPIVHVDKEVLLEGHIIRGRYLNSIIDYTNHSADIFSRDEYHETRFRRSLETHKHGLSRQLDNNIELDGALFDVNNSLVLR